MAPAESTPPFSTPDPPPPPDDGLVVVVLVRVFGRSWKTTLCGWVAISSSVITGLAAALPDTLPKVLVVLANVVGPMVGGVGLMAAKDHNVSGRSVR